MTRERKRSPDTVLAAIRHAESEIGMPPTIAELRDRLQVGSTRTVLRYLQDLEQRGWITRWPGARGMKVNEERREP